MADGFTFAREKRVGFFLRGENEFIEFADKMEVIFRIEIVYFIIQQNVLNADSVLIITESYLISITSHHEKKFTSSQRDHKTEISNSIP